MTKKKINLLFDATEMVDHLKNETGTGIYTVSYNILRELSGRQNVYVELYCSDAKRQVLKETVGNQKSWINNLKIFEKSELNKFDVFFSPMRAVPDLIENSKFIKKYVMLHDIMPVKFHYYWRDVKNHWYEELFNQLNKSDYYFTNSIYTQQDFIKYNINISRENSTALELACDDTFQPSKLSLKTVLQKYKIPLNKKYIFSLCSIEPRKNLLRAVKTFITFTKKNDINDVIFVFGGSKWGKFLELLQKEIASTDVQDKIIYIGYVDKEDLPALYSGAEWFVYTSQYEGFGLPPLEAMACGCPVITSNNSSLPEVVGDAGIMIDWDSDEQHIEAYEKYYFDEKFRKKMAKRGLEKSKQFSWKKTVDIIESIIVKHLKISNQISKSETNRKIIKNKKKILIDVNFITKNWQINSPKYKDIYDTLEALLKNQQVEIYGWADYHRYDEIFNVISNDPNLKNIKLITRANLSEMDACLILSEDFDKALLQISHMRFYMYLLNSSRNDKYFDEINLYDDVFFVQKEKENFILENKKSRAQNYVLKQHYVSYDTLIEATLTWIIEDLSVLKKIIPVVLFTDNNYVTPTIVTVTSILINRNNNTEYCIYVLGNDLSESNINKLKKILGINVIPHQDRFSQFAGAKSHCTTTDLFKFDLPIVFPRYDKILYLDVDMIIQHDLSELYGTDISDGYVAAVKDMHGMVGGRHHNRLGLKDYFNAGMMLLNLKKMRQDNISDKLIEYKAHKDAGIFMSQDALNCVFNDKVKFLSPIYNYMAPNLQQYTEEEIKKFYEMTEAEYSSLVRNAHIVHLTNNKKAWQYKSVWGSGLWAKYYKKSILKDELYFYRDDFSCLQKNDAELQQKGMSLNKIISLKQERIIDNGDSYIIKKYIMGWRYYREVIEKKPTIVLVYDFPDWIIGRWAKQIGRVLGKKFNFILTTFYQVKDNPEYYRELFKKVDIVHLLVGYPYFYYKSLTEKTKILPTIHHWLNYEKQIKSIAEDCMHILCVSSQYKNALEEKGIDKSKISLIFNGIEDRFLQEHKPLYKKKKDVVNVGFFAKATSNNEDRKGTRHFIALLDEIKKRGLVKKFHIYLTGTGWDNFVKSIKAEGFIITYIPFVKDKDMPRLYKTLDFYLMLSDIEGGPVTVMEAMASKTLVLATNIGVVQDIGRDKENIVLVDNKNTTDILDKILYYTEHKSEYEALTAEAYKTAQNMTYDKTFAPLEKVYNNMLWGQKLVDAPLDIKALNKKFRKLAYSVKDEKAHATSVPWRFIGSSERNGVRKFFVFGIPLFGTLKAVKKNGNLKIKKYFLGIPYFYKEKAAYKDIYHILGTEITVWKNLLCKKMEFSKQVNSSTDISGLSHAEKWGRWSCAETVTMMFKLPVDKGDLKFSFNLKPYLNEYHRQQKVSVFVNDSFVAEWKFEHKKAMPKTEFVLPQKMIKKSGKSFVEFRIEHPVSPKDLGLAADARKLGVGFVNMLITPAIVKESKIKKLWRKIFPPKKQEIDYLPEFKALLKEVGSLKSGIDMMQKEIKTLKNEQITIQKMLVDEKVLLQKKRRLK